MNTEIVTTLRADWELVSRDKMLLWREYRGLGVNPGAAFALEPLDRSRLIEATEFLRSIGFVVQTVLAVRQAEDYAMITIEFGQAPDPRIKP